MDLKIDDKVVAGFRDKDSKKPHFRELYEKHPFLEAYARHTDLRMEADPKWAIGRGDEWESHGLQQLEFLKSEGLKPSHFLLDVGCGPGRAARRFVPYLDPARYVGVDISPRCLAYAEQLAVDEGWADRKPSFVLEGDLSFTDAGLTPVDRAIFRFDFIWAHSVFTHLPPQQIQTMIANASKLLMNGGKFLFTYKPADRPQRSGLKQFQFPWQFFASCAQSAGLICTPLDYLFPAHQRTIRLDKPA